MFLFGLKTFSTIIFLIVSLAFEVYSQVPGQVQPQVIQRKTILDFKEKLRLSQEQVYRIERIIRDFEGKVRGINEKIAKLDREIIELLEREGELKEVERKVKELFSLRADVVIEELRAGRTIDRLLNDEQRKRCREIRRGGAQNR